MYEAATLLAMIAFDDKPSDEVSEVIAYHNYLEKVGGITRAFYRESAVAILAKNIGDRSAHGEANERIMQGVVEWMEEHGDDVGGLDRSLPLLPQLDRLTAEQLREAFRSMDPMTS